MCGLDLEGVFDLRTVDDAIRIKNALAEGPSVVVGGMGFIGSEVAASLRQKGLELSLDHRFGQGITAFANYSWQGDPEVRNSGTPYPSTELVLPPTRSFDSKTVTSAPAWRRRSAALRPAIPAPTTTTRRLAIIFPDPSVSSTSLDDE